VSPPLPASLRPPLDAVGRAHLVRRVLQVVLVLNLVVVAAKLVVWSWTNAISILAEATHSGLDALNNVIALAFARIALRAPDEDHPYGHQKFETLGALVVVGFLSITVWELSRGAVSRLLAETPPELLVPGEAIGLLAASGVLGIFIALYEAREGRRLDSELLLADAAHTRADVLGTAAVLGGLFLVRAGWGWIDPVVTLALAAFISYSGWAILKRTVPLLVDERAVASQRIRRMAEEADGVVRAYSIRSRGRPGEVFVELTVSVEPTLDVEKGHEIADAVERDLMHALSARRVVVHVEPSRQKGDPTPEGAEPGP
jgi:cation diffusion facilitator family transporter